MYILNKDNIIDYAAENYRGIRLIDDDDLSRLMRSLRFVAREISKDEIQYQIILNNIIILFNTFNAKATVTLLFYHIDVLYHNRLKSVLIFLKYLPYDISEYVNDDVQPCAEFLKNLESL